MDTARKSLLMRGRPFPDVGVHVTKGEEMTTAIASSESYCRDCGAVIKARAEICPKCGVRQKILVNGGRNRISAAILALFLGGLGAHKFYLGQSGAGIVYLLFCWTLIPAFISFFEAIILLSMSDEAFQAKYNQA
jgi:TM2 domain-containing membrane protein YozV/ribosomal protein L40E